MGHVNPEGFWETGANFTFHHVAGTGAGKTLSRVGGTGIIITIGWCLCTINMQL